MRQVLGKLAHQSQFRATLWKLIPRFSEFSTDPKTSRHRAMFRPNFGQFLESVPFSWKLNLCPQKYCQIIRKRIFLQPEILLWCKMQSSKHVSERSFWVLLSGGEGWLPFLTWAATSNELFLLREAQSLLARLLSQRAVPRAAESGGLSPILSKTRIIFSESAC